MLKKKTRFWLVSIAAVLTLLVTISKAQANCADQIAKLELYQHPMERHWQELQQQTTYSWGKARPYSTLSGSRITLTKDFDPLTGLQKKQVLETLLQGFKLLPEEQEVIQKVGAYMLPYKIYANDGRIVSAPYDGCTRFSLLTERERYSWYYNTADSNRPRSTLEEELRNAGHPSWREVRFPISAAQEKTTRLKFWNVLGWKASDWWIAWVPENGYFEINVPPEYDQSRLEQFWQVAPRQYRYVVVATDGTLLRERIF